MPSTGARWAGVTRPRLIMSSSESDEAPTYCLNVQLRLKRAIPPPRHPRIFVDAVYCGARFMIPLQYLIFHMHTAAVLVSSLFLAETKDSRFLSLVEDRAAERREEFLQVDPGT